MPFKSWDEMKRMKRRNPALARKYIRHAKAQGKPVVSDKNPGYKNVGYNNSSSSHNSSGYRKVIKFDPDALKRRRARDNPKDAPNWERGTVGGPTRRGTSGTRVDKNPTQKTATKEEDIIKRRKKFGY